MTDRRYQLERIDDAAVVQLYDDGFAALSLNEKRLVWHLYEAALWGRDIFYDQRHRHNLAMRDVLEAVIRFPAGIDPETRAEITRYTKLFWLNTGPWSHLTSRKTVLRCAPDAFAAAVKTAIASGAQIALPQGVSLDEHLATLAPIFFDPQCEPSVTNKSPVNGGDILAESWNNLYSGVTMGDLEGFEERHPLNSRLVKHPDGRLEEQVYRVGGLYSAAIERIVASLQSALPFATDAMRKALEALIRFYRTGEDADRVAYDIAWTHDKASPVDTINGFIEVYLDARGRKGAWEALVYHVNPGKTHAIAVIAQHAQWFEDRMPYAPEFRREQVQGVTATAIDVVIETGDSGPMTPIGINLPNDDALREIHGSKSVSLANIVEAYDKSMPEEFRIEFSWDEAEAARSERWSSLAAEITTNLHEVVGHGSGKASESLIGTPQERLKEQYSSLEETRADLVALFFVADPIMVTLGLVGEADHADLLLAEYEGYARNALSQLRRIREGNHIEEDHMRNRQAIIYWLMAHTSAIETRVREGKTYYVVVDVEAFRVGVGQLLAEIQRIKSEGDYEAARTFFERYGTYFDPVLRDEIVRRVDALGLPSYSGFVMPTLTPTYGDDGTIAAVDISYPLDLTTQMLDWSTRYRV